MAGRMLLDARATNPSTVPSNSATIVDGSKPMPRPPKREPRRPVHERKQYDDTRLSARGAHEAHELPEQEPAHEQLFEQSLQRQVARCSGASTADAALRRAAACRPHQQPDREQVDGGDERASGEPASVQTSRHPKATSGGRGSCRRR